MNTLVVRIAVCLLWALGLMAFISGCGDTYPPDVPANVNATAVSDTAIDVSWDAASSPRGVEGYRIYRDGVYYAKTGSIEFRDSGLTNSTQYCYRVQAYDEDDVRSDKSKPACATTYAAPDNTAPTAPAGLTATVVNSTAIDLDWTASTDANGIDYYNIYRKETSYALINTSTTNSYSDTGLTNSTTYFYIVNAVDPAGNVSPASGEASATTNP